MFKGISINGTRYFEDSNCPSCSSEVDNGGRLELKKLKNFFLKCKKCKYSIKSERVINKQLSYLKKRRDKQVGLK